MGFSTTAEFDQAYQIVQGTFASGTTKNKGWRRRQLKRAWWMIEDNKKRICDALYTDLHKHYQEAYTGDCGNTQADILRTLKKLDEWTKDERPEKSDPLNFLGRATVRKEPLGVTLIIGAWNFPVSLLLQPMIAAIAAGCAVILKPSDVASATQDVLMEIVPQYMDQDAIRCISAGPQEMGYILEHRFDHIFYTGSPNVAKIIHAAAAKHLTPVTLELGGQCPAIVAKSANLDLTAKHIAVTKFMNAGQICLNVNHVLVHPSLRERLVADLSRYFDKFLGGKANNPEYYTHIINERNFDRLDNLLQQTSGKIVYGGQRDRQSLYFAPTIVTGVKPGDSLLSEELFGPILPIVDADFDTALSRTRAGEHPLAIYAFTTQDADKARILNETQSGGVTFNDCGLHIAACDVPFGGVGNSGQGRYHGPHGILTFSHLRTHINAVPSWLEWLLAARYPPYSVQKAHKLVAPVTPSFDRDGNDTTFAARSKWAFGVGILALSALFVTRQDQIAALGYKWLNFRTSTYPRNITARMSKDMTMAQKRLPRQLSEVPVSTPVNSILPSFGGLLTIIKLAAVHGCSSHWVTESSIHAVATPRSLNSSYLNVTSAHGPVSFKFLFSGLTINNGFNMTRLEGLPGLKVSANAQPDYTITYNADHSNKRVYVLHKYTIPKSFTGVPFV